MDSPSAPSRLVASLMRHRRGQVAAMNDPRWAWLRRRRVRRALVLVGAACMLTWAGSTVLIDLEVVRPDDYPVFLLVPFVSMLTALGLARLAGRATRGLTTLLPFELDERQRAAQSRVYHLAYGILVMVMMLGTAIVLLAQPLRSLHRSGIVYGLVMPTFFFVLFLPGAVAAWTEPDEEAD